MTKPTLNKVFKFYALMNDNVKYAIKAKPTAIKGAGVFVLNEVKIKGLLSNGTTETKPINLKDTAGYPTYFVYIDVPDKPDRIEERSQGDDRVLSQNQILEKIEIDSRLHWDAVDTKTKAKAPNKSTNNEYNIGEVLQLRVQGVDLSVGITSKNQKISNYNQVPEVFLLYGLTLYHQDGEIANSGIQRGQKKYMWLAVNGHQHHLNISAQDNSDTGRHFMATKVERRGIIGSMQQFRDPYNPNQHHVAAPSLYNPNSAPSLYPRPNLYNQYQPSFPTQTTQHQLSFPPQPTQYSVPQPTRYSVPQPLANQYTVPQPLKNPSFPPAPPFT
jgi:hypothetical protein